VIVQFESQQNLLVSTAYSIENFLFFTFKIVDASKAGEGSLEISVNHSGHNIPHQTNHIGNGRFEVQFIPQKAVKHYCIILFNGELVPGK
jgi:hypothetical protein